MSKYVVKSISFKPEILEKIDRIVNESLIPGINDRSALVNYALGKIFKEVCPGENKSAV